MHLSGVFFYSETRSITLGSHMYMDLISGVISCKRVESNAVIWRKHVSNQELGPLIITWMWWAFSTAAKSYRHSFQAYKSGADGISPRSACVCVCVVGGGEIRRKASVPFVEHKSHLSQIRTGAALVLFDVPLGGGLGGVQMGVVGCGGADCWSTNRCSRLILWGGDETPPQRESPHPTVSRLTRRQG